MCVFFLVVLFAGFMLEAKLAGDLILQLLSILLMCVFFFWWFFWHILCFEARLAGDLILQLLSILHMCVWFFVVCFTRFVLEARYVGGTVQVENVDKVRGLSAIT